MDLTAGLQRAHNHVRKSMILICVLLLKGVESASVSAFNHNAVSLSIVSYDSLEVWTLNQQFCWPNHPRKIPCYCQKALANRPCPLATAFESRLPGVIAVMFTG